MTHTPTIESLIEQWIDAFNAHDLDRHTALYTPDAMLFGAVDELHDGRDAIRSYFEDRGPGVHVKTFAPPLIRQIGDGIAVTSGHVDFADGTQLMPYRLSWTLVQRDGNWRIAQHHGSPRRAE